MRLDSPSRFTSFYESFSDLIFATMAIFVLLMMVFLTLINPPENTDELERQLKEFSEKIIELERSVEKAEFEKVTANSQLEALAQELAEQNEAVKSSALELIIAVDTTGSMEGALVSLKTTIKTILKVLPSASTEFKIAIVAYTNGLNIFPGSGRKIRQIQPENKDNGSSLSEIYKFLDSLTAQSGAAPVELAIKKAIELSSSTDNFNGFQTIMLLGDVGPYEFLDSQGNIQAQLDQSGEQRVYRMVNSWASESKRRNFISVFSGYNNRDLDKSSEIFFKKLAEHGGGRENFTNNPNDMLVFLLTSVFKEN